MSITRSSLSNQLTTSILLPYIVPRVILFCIILSPTNTFTFPTQALSILTLFKGIKGYSAIIVTLIEIIFPIKSRSSRKDTRDTYFRFKSALLEIEYIEPVNTSHSKSRDTRSHSDINESSFLLNDIVASFKILFEILNNGVPFETSCQRYINISHTTPDIGEVIVSLLYSFTVCL